MAVYYYLSLLSAIVIGTILVKFLVAGAGGSKRGTLLNSFIAAAAWPALLIGTKIIGLQGTALAMGISLAYFLVVKTIFRMPAKNATLFLFLSYTFRVTIGLAVIPRLFTQLALFVH